MGQKGSCNTKDSSGHILDKLIKNIPEHNQRSGYGPYEQRASLLEGLGRAARYARGVPFKVAIQPLTCPCLHGRPPVRYSGCGTASLGPPTPARLLSDLLVWAVPGTAAASHLRFLCQEAGTERRASAHGRAGVLKRPEAA